MSTDKQSNNDSRDNSITVVEYLAEQERLEKEAKELFPKKFDMCTNSLGYIRQTLYSCLTCNPNPGEEAGFCYACSISCHGDHQLVELFTKRSFRCDCGTDKFRNTVCKLDPKPKGTLNPLNHYNHNYLGRFCWCDKQYDPMKEESTMLQCVVCEDWFHDECIGVNPHTDDFDDFICRSCTRNHPFLRLYANDPLFIIGLSAGGSNPQSASAVFNKQGGQEKVVVESNGTERVIDNVSTPATDRPTDEQTKTSPTTATTPKKRELERNDGRTEEQGDHTKRLKTDAAPTTTATSPAADDGVSIVQTLSSTTAPVPKPREPCLLDGLSDPYPDREMSLFASDGWRDKLCRCKACMHVYMAAEKVPFILGEDPIYEDEDDDEDGASLLENGLKRLEKVDRVKVMDGMLAYTKFSDEIKSFLKPFSEQGKVVTAADISAFFSAKMEARRSSA